MNQQALANLLTEVGRDIDASPLTCFWPSPPLEEAMTDPHRKQLWRLPNRAGKTRHAMARVAKAAKATPGFRARVIGPTMRTTQDVMGKYLAEFLEGYLAPGSYYTDGKGWNTTTIRLANGSIIQLRSYEDKPISHAGDELDLVVMDEPPPRGIFTENMARVMSRRGQVILTLTPIGRPVEWLRDMVEDERSGWKEYHAVFSHESVPWYTPAMCEEHLETMRAAPWEYAQRVEAAWEGYEVERMFVGFTDANLTDTDPSGKFSVALMMDHGEKVGHEVALLAAYNGTRITFIDEYVSSSNTSPEEDAHELLALFARNGLPPKAVDLAVGDINSAGKGYSGWSANQAIMTSMARALGTRSPPFRIVSADKTAGTKDWSFKCLNYGFRRGDIKVHERCRNFVKTLQGWKGTTKGDDGKLAHLADAAGYGSIAILRDDKTYANLRIG